MCPLTFCRCLSKQFDIVILGKVISRPTTFNRELCERVLLSAGDTPAMIGKTMCWCVCLAHTALELSAHCLVTISMKDKVDWMVRCVITQLKTRWRSYVARMLLVCDSGVLCAFLQ
jgi:hypothetical protein